MHRAAVVGFSEDLTLRHENGRGQTEEGNKPGEREFLPESEGLGWGLVGGHFE